MKVLICYLSYSGNTKEVAEILHEELINHNMDTDIYEIDMISGSHPRNLSSYDYIILGTFTWGKGRVPQDFKDFIWETGVKPKNVAVFGTGDTQFGGDDLFCGAVDKLIKFYDSQYDGLKIEQSPRGNQEGKVREWIDGVISTWKS